jgi:hypothetical protein
VNRVSVPSIPHRPGSETALSDQKAYLLLIKNDQIATTEDRLAFSTGRACNLLSAEFHLPPANSFAIQQPLV